MPVDRSGCEPDPCHDAWRLGWTDKAIQKSILSRQHRRIDHSGSRAANPQLYRVITALTLRYRQDCNRHKRGTSPVKFSYRKLPPHFSCSLKEVQAATPTRRFLTPCPGLYSWGVDALILTLFLKLEQAQNKPSTPQHKGVSGQEAYAMPRQPHMVLTGCSDKLAVDNHANAAACWPLLVGFVEQSLEGIRIITRREHLSRFPIISGL